MWQSLRIHHKASSYSEHLLAGTCSFYLSIKGVLTTFIQLTEEYLLFLTLEGPTIPVASTESWMKKKYSKAREEIISIWYWAGTQLEIQTWPSFWWCLLRKSPDKKSEVCWGVINHFIICITKVVAVLLEIILQCKQFNPFDPSDSGHWGCCSSNAIGRTQLLVSTLLSFKSKLHWRRMQSSHAANCLDGY